MSTSVKAKSRIASKGCAIAFAVAPVVVPIFCSPNRVRASVLFAFDQPSVTSSPSPFDNYGPIIVLPSNTYSFNASQLPNGGIKISGDFGPVPSTGLYAAENGDISMSFGFYGSFAGDIFSGDVFTASIALNAAATGGTLSFLGMKATNEVGLNAEDLTSLPIGNNTFTHFISSSTATDDVADSYSVWSVVFGIGWIGAGVNDSFTLSIPTNSLDAYISPVPEPVSAAMLVLPAIVALSRRRPPICYSDGEANYD